MNFTFLNIPVRIEPTFWIFLLFFSGLYRDPSMESAIVVIVMFISLLIHEYGHALTAVYFGARPAITLQAFGGNAQYASQGISKLQQFFITLNGPLLQSLLIFIPYYLLESGVFDSHYYALFILYVTMRINILWCLLNLIPIDPLDGGHLVRYFLEEKFGSKGYKISLVIGLVSVALIVPYLYSIGITFFSIFLAFLAFQSLQKLTQLSKQEAVPPFSLYQQGVEAANSNHAEKAKKIFKKLLKCKDSYIKHAAIEALAKIYLDENQSQKSYELLLKAEHQSLQQGKSLLCKLAFERDNHQLVGQYSFDSYEAEPTYETAIRNSQAFAHLNQPELAGGWLATASQFGADSKDKIRELLKHTAYDAMREHEAFNKALPTLDLN